jgi:DNA polymerase-3 subunit alpha
MPDFVHLHCHTEFSLLDGAIRLKDLCSRANDFKMPAAAITDHGNLFGAATFWATAKKAGIKPIIGSEVYVAKTHYEDRETPDAKRRYHLVLLAQNLTGWKNLIKLVTTGYTKGFHYKPRVDRELLSKHSEGLIALSACLQGEVPRTLLDHGFDAAKKTAEIYSSIFPDRFYLEVQANGLKEQERLNEQLFELAEETALPLVATNDCHYLEPADHEAHDVLLCVQTNACVEDERRMKMDGLSLHYTSPEEMAAAFSGTPEAIDNTVRIAEQCNVDLNLGRLYFPAYDLPEGKSLDEELRDMSRDGLKERLELIQPEDKKPYWDRLELELDVINEMGFPGYFLIVQDFINWAKEQGIPVGPGRGSAAGSLVSYALKITNIDPLPYNLLFERFLNIERVSMPDIDVDFCERRRGEVIDYVADKYGKECVAQITTFGTMKAKAVVRDVGRALGMSYQETDKIAKLIPEELKMTIDKALEKEPDLKELVGADDRVAKLIDVSRRLEGMHRHASTHAAGLVISNGPMTDYLPLYKGKRDEIVTQFDMKMVEKIGLIKFDFLGLRTMTVVEDTLDIIRETGKEAPDLDTLSLDDPATYEVYARGDTDGIFQVESAGMRKYLRKLKPTCFDDVIAMLALYRPGPLGSGMVDEFIDRKHGRKEVEYPLPQLEDVLKDTYGVIVYQEQVMKIAQVVAGYSLGGADLLRRAMGKKIAEAMAEQRDIFMKGAAELEVPKDKAGEVFDLMEKFAEYGFNKSHSAAYALISYYTAYLKAHYPTEFMAALITSEAGNQDKVLKYLGACRDMEVKVLPPDVNVSRRRFAVKGEGEIVYGMGALKNIGDEAIKNIVEEREENGPYKSFLDLCTRVNLRKVNKRALESLIKSGSCDCFERPRAELMEGMDRAVALAQKRAKNQADGRVSLFEMTGEELPVMPGLGFELGGPPIQEWSDEEKLSFEKDVIGFYLTGHPLLAHHKEIQRLGLNTLSECADMPPDATVRSAVIVTGLKKHITKKGNKMAFCDVEDLSGSGEAVLFPEAFQAAEPLIEADKPILLEGKISAYRGNDGGGDQGGNKQSDNGEENQGPKRAKITVEAVQDLMEAFEKDDTPLLIQASVDRFENGGLTELKDILARHRGSTCVRLRILMPDSIVGMELDATFCVSPCAELHQELSDWRSSEAPQAEEQEVA